VMSFTTSR